MKVSEAIDRLEVGDEVWVKGVVDVVYRGLHPSINIREVGWFSENTEISLTEPQSEKVEVPSCMGTFLDRYPDKKETAMHIIMHDFTESKYFDEFAELPLADYPMGWDRLMASALMFGYTVKPKRWVVRLDNGRYVNDFQEAEFCIGIGITLEMDCLPPFKFTDKSKADAVAVLVEGSVEEV